MEEQDLPYVCLGEEDTMEDSAVTDFISELPDCLLVHILSNLETLHAVRTCVLSKRWRYLWTSLPCLCFRHRSYASNDEFGKQTRFVEFIDNVMSVHCRSSSTIHTLRIHENNGEHHVTNDCVVRWINVGLQHNLVELDIHINLDLALPHSLFDCKSLEKLTICLHKWKLGRTLKTPADLVDLPALKMLYLHQLMFVGEDVNNLIARCPVLETLGIVRCRMLKTSNLIVNAPQLKHLKIDNLTRFGGHQFYVHKVTACTPNLTSFECKEYGAMGEYTLLNAVNAEIELPISKSAYNRRYWDKILVARNVKKCLAELSKVKALTVCLPDWLLQDIFVPPAQGPYLHDPPYSLTVLKLTTSVVEQHTCCRSYLLEMCPNLETLVLDIVKEPSYSTGHDQIIVNSVDEECMQMKLPLECISHHLKFVEICGETSCLETEFAFVKFLLKSALVLETLSFQHIYRDDTSRIVKFVKEVKAIPITSPNVKISLFNPIFCI